MKNDMKIYWRGIVVEKDRYEINVFEKGGRICIVVSDYEEEAQRVADELVATLNAFEHIKQIIHQKQQQ